MNLKERAKNLKTDIPAVFLALKDGKTPWYAKVLAAVVVVYALSPIDLIPDFIPGLGDLGDLIILPPKEVLASCRSRARGMWGGGKPEKWYYAIPFVLIWVGLIALIVLALI